MAQLSLETFDQFLGQKSKSPRSKASQVPRAERPWPEPLMERPRSCCWGARGWRNGSGWMMDDDGWNCGVHKKHGSLRYIVMKHYN